MFIAHLPLPRQLLYSRYYENGQLTILELSRGASILYIYMSVGGCVLIIIV